MLKHVIEKLSPQASNYKLHIAIASREDALPLPISKFEIFLDEMNRDSISADAGRKLSGRENLDSHTLGGGNQPRGRGKSPRTA